MRALRLLDWKPDPVLVDVAEPEPGPGEVVIQIGGAGACHSDLHLMHEFEPGLLPWQPPFTLGHENAGWVKQLGPGAAGFEVGQPVAVVGAWGCGVWPACKSTYCGHRAEPVEVPDLAARSLRRPGDHLRPRRRPRADDALACGEIDGRAVIILNTAYRP